VEPEEPGFLLSYENTGEGRGSGYHGGDANKVKKFESARKIADLIRAFIDNTCGPYDWDDFTCGGPLGDPALDAIRKDASLVPLPGDDASVSKLRELLDRATDRQSN